MKNTDLYLCHTPLQALIAQTLIRQNNAPADLLMMCYAPSDNAKFRHYFQQTAALCRHAQYIVLPNNAWLQALRLPRLLRHLSPQYRTIFAASIDNAHIQYPLSHLQFDALHTFDDGVANLCPDSILYRNPSRHFLRNWGRALLGIHHDTEDLRRLSQRHYTLYPNMDNIVPNPIALNIWLPEEMDTAATSDMTMRRIFLGQPLLPEESHNAQLSEQSIQHFDIQEYFPHPRTTQHPKNALKIHTNRIFEDWLLQEIRQNPHHEFTVYHWASSAAFNVVNFPRVHVCTIRPDTPFFRQPYLCYLYDLMQKISMPIQDFSPNKAPL